VEVNKMKKEKLVEIISNIPKDEYLEVFEDAWTIWAPERFTRLGFPEDYITKFETKFESDGTFKGNITVDGEVVDHVTGVQSRDVAFDIARILGLKDALDDAFDKYGRGSALRAVSHPIWNEVHN
jgi:hypothetical protein